MGGQINGMDDSVLDEIEESERVDEELGTQITILNTNARSLCPKIESMINCFDEMSSTVGVITETWLADGDSLWKDIDDLAAGAGIGMICLNCKQNAAGVAHGGVAVAYRTGVCTMKRIDLPNPERFEVLVTLATLPGYSRKLVTVGCYLPPGYPVARGRAGLAHAEELIREIKRRYRDPFVVVAGDFNQWDIADALQDFPDLREADVETTRKNCCLDRVFSNFERAVKESGTVLPLKTEPGTQGSKSGHRVAFVRAKLPNSSAPARFQQDMKGNVGAPRKAAISLVGSVNAGSITMDRLLQMDIPLNDLDERTMDVARRNASPLEWPQIWTSTLARRSFWIRIRV